MKDKKLDPIIVDIKHSFAFLLNRGYSIHRVETLPMGDWRVTLASGNISVIIYSDRGEIGLVFSPLNSKLSFRAGLEGMIYFLSDGETFIGKANKGIFSSRRKEFERLANLLRKYVDQIVPYFGEDYEKHEHAISLKQQEYLRLFMDKYVSNRKSRE